MPKTGVWTDKTSHMENHPAWSPCLSDVYFLSVLDKVMQADLILDLRYSLTML